MWSWMVCTAEYVAKVDSCSIITSAATASAAASAASAASTVVLMGSPPPGCAIQEHFEDAPSLQAVVRDAREPALPRSQWEREMERRMASSEKMLQEIHTMVLASCGVCARCFKQCRTGDRWTGSRCSGVGARFPGAASCDRSSCPDAATAIWFLCQ